jgi:hypothetical protein
MLYLDQNGRVHRKLAWARFEGGEPVPLPPTRQSSTGDLPPDGIDPGALPPEWQTSGQNEQ